MSFPRAAIRRFNETADNSIPPIGFYDPKFTTDVAASSTLKRIGFIDRWGRASSNNNVVGSESSVASGAPLGAAGIIPLRTRSSSVGFRVRKGSVTRTSTASEPRQATSRVSFASSVSVSGGRIDRDASTGKLTRRRSSTAGISPIENMNMRRKSSHTRVGRSFSKPKLPRPRSRSPVSSKTNSILRHTPSTTCSFKLCSPQLPFVEAFRDTLKAEGAFYPMAVVPFQTAPSAPTDDSLLLEPGEVCTHPRSSRSQINSFRAIHDSHASSSRNIFDEIQSLAEGLQTELSEYKAKLSKERARIQELEAKKLELEFINHSLKRQVEKYDKIKDSWEAGELDNQSTVHEMVREKEMMEVKVGEIQNKVEDLAQSELDLKEKVNQLEQEKLQWQEEERKYEVTIDGFSTLLQEEQSKRSEVEKHIKELETQMDTCYHTCESRMADTENMKETYEVKVQELQEHVTELVTKLDNIRRELEIQKTLMIMVKKEHQEEQEKNKTLSQQNE